MKYVIPDIPKSNNEYIGRSNIHQYQDDKKMWCEMLWAYCRPRPDKPYDKAIVVITYHFPDKIRRDPDNYSGKMILDGLVRNGIIKDDSFLCIRLILDAEFGCRKKETVIEVIEVVKSPEQVDPETDNPSVTATPRQLPRNPSVSTSSSHLPKDLGGKTGANAVPYKKE